MGEAFCEMYTRHNKNRRTYVDPKRRPSSKYTKIIRCEHVMGTLQWVYIAVVWIAGVSAIHCRKRVYASGIGAGGRNAAKRRRVHGAGEFACVDMTGISLHRVASALLDRIKGSQLKYYLGAPNLRSKIVELFRFVYTMEWSITQLQCIPSMGKNNTFLFSILFHPLLQIDSIWVIDFA